MDRKPWSILVGLNCRNSFFNCNWQHIHTAPWHPQREREGDTRNRGKKKKKNHTQNVILIVQLFRKRLPQTFAFHFVGTCNYSFRRACFVPLYWDALYPPTSPSHLVFDIDILMIAYIALFSTLLSRLTALTWGSTRVTSFIAHFF